MRAASARVRARAAKGRTHHTYHGIVQPSVRTVASMTKPGGARQPCAPPGHGRGRAHGGQRQHGVGDDAIVGRQPTLAGERGEHVGHAQRPDEPVLDARRGQVAAVDDPTTSKDSTPALPAPPRAGRRRRQAKTTTGARRAADGLKPAASTAQAPAPTSHHGARPLLPADDGQRHRRHAAQQHQRLVVGPADAVDEHERVEAHERDRGLRRAPEPARGEGHQHEGAERGRQQHALPRPIRGGQRERREALGDQGEERPVGRRQVVPVGEVVGGVLADGERQGGVRIDAVGRRHAPVVQVVEDVGQRQRRPHQQGDVRRHHRAPDDGQGHPRRAQHGHQPGDAEDRQRAREVGLQHRRAVGQRRQPVRQRAHHPPGEPALGRAGEDRGPLRGDEDDGHRQAHDRAHRRGPECGKAEAPGDPGPAPHRAAGKAGHGQTTSAGGPGTRAGCPRRLRRGPRPDFGRVRLLFDSC